MFLCFGFPKSGTTFLQRCLNSHPDISCPSEHDSLIFLRALQSWLPKYNEALALIDQRTGGQGCTPLDAETAKQIYAAVLPVLAQRSSGGKAIYGLNDNALFGHVPMIDRLLPGTKMICILRNPLDIAVSSWDHNHRLAEREEDPGQHTELMAQKGETLDEWANFICARHGKMMRAYIDHTRDRPNHTLVLYDDLVQDTATSLEKLIAFLGATTSPETLQSISRAHSLDAMRATAADPGFFRAASMDRGAGRVSEPLRQRLLDDWDQLKTLTNQLGGSIAPTR